MNTYYIAGYPVTDELYHHGIKGQKWGLRRYQNDDGSLTPAGRERYGKSESARGLQKQLNRADKEAAYAIGRMNKSQQTSERLTKKAMKIANKSTDENGKINLSERNRKKLTKYAEKAEKAESEYKSASNDLKKIESRQWKLMGEAAEQGYSVLAAPKYRSTVRAGEQFKNSLLYGGIGAGIKQVRDYSASGAGTMGNKFKVKKDGMGRVSLPNR